MRDTEKCDICGADVDTSRQIEPYDFLNVCEQHAEYRHCFQMTIIKFRLGIIQDYPEMKCAVCGKQLTREEINAIDIKEFQACCSEHKWSAFVFQTSVIKEVLEKYPDTNSLEQLQERNHLIMKQKEKEFDQGKNGS